MLIYKFVKSRKVTTYKGHYLPSLAGMIVILFDSAPPAVFLFSILSRREVCPPPDYCGGVTWL